MRTDYTRNELIELCERASVDESQWHDRDSAAAQMQIGEAWALLRAGCDFEIEKDNPVKFNSVWVKIYFEGFEYFENGEDKNSDVFYIPQPERIRADGGDWY